MYFFLIVDSVCVARTLLYIYTASQMLMLS